RCDECVWWNKESGVQSQKNGETAALWRTRHWALRRSVDPARTRAPVYDGNFESSVCVGPVHQTLDRLARGKPRRDPGDVLTSNSPPNLSVPVAGFLDRPVRSPHLAVYGRDSDWAKLGIGLWRDHYYRALPYIRGTGRDWDR